VEGARTEIAPSTMLRMVPLPRFAREELLTSLPTPTDHPAYVGPPYPNLR
jgi:hypothetical protein